MSAAQQTARASEPHSPIDRLVILGTPLLFAVVLLFHPQGDETRTGIFDVLAGQAGRWVVVHVAQLVLTVPLGFAVWKLVEGQRRAATVSRLAIATFMVFSALMTRSRVSPRASSSATDGF
jgi:hypothetical protein